MKKYLIWSVILSFFVSLIVFGLGLYAYDINKTNESFKEVSNVEMGDYIIISGVVRNAGDGWKLIQDKTHETVGINEVTQDEEAITIHYDEKEKINSISVTVDETMASEGYTVGASVGTSIAIISIYDKDKNLVDPSDYTNSSGNIWIQGVFKK